MAYYLQNPRMAWTEEEDQCLRAAVERYGVKRWAQIAALLPGRTSKACSHRWRTYLQPGVMHTSTNPFTDWEVAVVKEAHKVLGNNWSAIARMLPGRTNAAVKNFWYAHKRRSQRARGRGHVVRQAGTADPADPASTADPDDEDLGDIELDADTEFGDMDEADGDFADEGDLGCEDLDDDDELPHDETAEQQHLVEGSIMHGAAYDMGGIPMMGSWDQNIGITASHDSQQQPTEDAPEGTPKKECYSMQALNSDSAAPESPVIAVAGSASPSTPVLRGTTGSSTDTPNHHSSSCGNTWSPQQQQQQQQQRPQQATELAGQSGSPEVPPTRESAAGAPPGSAGLGAFLGSPLVAPNGHSSAGAPPGTDSVAGVTPGPSSADHTVSPVVPPTDLGSTAAAAAQMQARISDGALMVATMGDLEVQDLADAALSLSGDVGAELALMRQSSGCLVDVHVQGTSVSHSSFLDDQLLPFSPLTLPTTYKQQHYSTHTGGSNSQLLGIPTAQCTSMTSAGVTQHGHWGIAELADSPQLQLQLGQKRRISQMHGYASQIAGHSRLCAAPTSAPMMHTGPSFLAGHSSCSNNSSWGGNMNDLEQQQMLRQQYCSDSGGGSSISGHDSMFPVSVSQWQQQQEYRKAGNQANMVLLQQQQTAQLDLTAGPFYSLTPAMTPPHGEQPVTPERQQKQPPHQRPQHMVKRFCLDLSDEALAAEKSVQQ